MGEKNLRDLHGLDGIHLLGCYLWRAHPDSPEAFPLLAVRMDCLWDDAPYRPQPPSESLPNQDPDGFVHHPTELSELVGSRSGGGLRLGSGTPCLRHWLEEMPHPGEELQHWKILALPAGLAPSPQRTVDATGE